MGSIERGLFRCVLELLEEGSKLVELLVLLDEDHLVLLLVRPLGLLVGYVLNLPLLSVQRKLVVGKEGYVIFAVVVGVYAHHTGRGLLLLLLRGDHGGNRPLFK